MKKVEKRVISSVLGVLGKTSQSFKESLEGRAGSRQVEEGTGATWPWGCGWGWQGMRDAEF